MSKTSIPIVKFKAAIFDMDGTMIDNMDSHKHAWQEFLKRHDVELSEDEFKKKVSGKKNDQILEEIFDKELSPEETNKYAEEKEVIYRQIYAPHIKEIKGLSQLIDNFHSKNIRTAIATTATEPNREFALKELGLEGKFEVILGDEHVDNGKPHPEIYLKTAKKLALSPDECIVFEDSPPGVESAKTAGMVVVGILTSHKESDISQADYIVNDYDEITLSL